MRKSVQKAIANKRKESNDQRPLRSQSKGARKLRKQVIEEDFGHLPIR